MKAKKLVSMILIAIMIVNLLPVQAFADGDTSTYTIIIDANGGVFDDGSSISEFTLKRGKNIGSVSTNWYPHKDGYSVNEFTVEETGEKIGALSLHGYVPNQDMRITVDWTKKCTVTFDANGGNIFLHNDDPTDTYSKVYLEGDTLESKMSDIWKVVSDFYTFVGWKLEGDDNSIVDPEQFIVTDSVTLVAVWKDKIKITVDANGGLFANGESTNLLYMNEGYYIGGLAYSEGQDIYPEKEGYIIAGYHVEETGEDLEPTDYYSYSPKTDVHIKVIWEEKTTLTVTFTANGGQIVVWNKGVFGVDEYSIEYNKGDILESEIDKQDLQVSEPSKHVLVGWKLENDDDNEIINTKEYVVTESIRLVAVYRETENIGPKLVHSGVTNEINWSIDENGLLKIWGTGDYGLVRTDNGAYIPPWREYSDEIKTAYVDVESITSTEGMFAGLTNLQEVDFANFDTSNVTNMATMFNGCQSLRSIDLSGLSTSNVTDMNNMFVLCNSLETLDLSTIDTSKVKDVAGMFFMVENLKTVKLGSLESATDMTEMFSCCSKLTSVEFFGTTSIPNVSSIYCMFNECSSLESIDLSSLTVSDECYVSGVFYGCNNLNKVIAPETVAKDMKVLPTSDGYCWKDETNTNVKCTILQSDTVKTYNRVIDDEEEDLTVLSITDMPERMDVGSSKYVTVSFNRELKTGESFEWVIDDPEIISISTGNTISALKPGKTEISYILNGVASETTYTVEVFGKYKTPSMPRIKSFGSNEIEIETRAGEVYSLDKLNWQEDAVFNGLEPDTDYNVYAKRTEDGYYYESDVSEPTLVHTCASNVVHSGITNWIYWSIDDDGLLKIWGIGDYPEVPWSEYSDEIKSASVDVKSICSTEGMFAALTNLQEVDLSNLDTSNVTNMNYMFLGCTSLNSIDLSKLDTSNVTDMYGMFAYCNSLETIDLSDINTSKVENAQYMFLYLQNLKSVKLGSLESVTDMSGMFNGCSKLTNVEFSKTSSVPNVSSISGMFADCGSLENVDLSSLIVSSDCNVDSIFNGCNNLKKVVAPENVAKDLEVLPSSDGYYWKDETNTYVDTSILQSDVVKSYYRVSEDDEELSLLDISGMPEKLNVGDSKHVNVIFNRELKTGESFVWVIGESEIISISTGNTISALKPGKVEISYTLNGVASETKYTVEVYGKYATPAAPSIKSYEAGKIEVVTEEGFVYSLDKENWQSEAVFGGLYADTDYNVYAKQEATEYCAESEISDPTKVHTKPHEVISITGIPEKMDVNDTAEITVEYNAKVPEGKEVKWTVSDSSILEISDDNVITALKLGKTEISYTLNGVASETKYTVEVYGKYATPAAPSIKSYEAGKIEVVTEDGFVYSLDKENWQSEAVFGGLYADPDYNVHAKQEATEYCAESEISDPTKVHTKPLEVVSITGIPEKMDVNDTAEITVEYNAKVPEGKEVKWTVSDNSILEISEENVITSKKTGAVTIQYSINDKLSDESFEVGVYDKYPKPEAPQVNEKTETSFTVNSMEGCEFSLDGEKWQESNAFDNLEPDTDYKVYAKKKANGYYTESDMSEPTSVHTDSFSVTKIQGIPEKVTAGDVAEIKVEFSGKLRDKDTFEWNIDGEAFVSVDESNVLHALKGGKATITCTLNGNKQDFTYMVEVYEPQAKPDAPKVATITDASIEVDTVENGQYSLDGEVWQDEGVFTELEADKDYVVYAKLKAHGYYLESEVSEGTKVHTNVIEPEVWPFKDVVEGTSLSDDVKFAYDKGIISGYGKPDENGQVNFKPGKNVTRAQFAIMIYNMAGKPDMGDLTGVKGFTDVKPGTTGYKEILWASSKGIISGFSDGRFKPDKEISRTQVAIMLKKYGDYCNYNARYATGGPDISSYNDAGSVKLGSEESLQWAIDQGILSGTVKNNLNPNGTARRDQCAAFFARFYRKFEE